MSQFGFDLFEFFQRFPNEESARAYFEKKHWGDTRSCPHCGSTSTSECKDHIPMPYRCKDCRKHFSVRTGTVMEESRLPLQKWLMAIYILTTHKKGISSIQLAKALGCRQSTAWFLAHRIREAILGRQGNGRMDGTIEADETFVGGKEANKHAKKQAESMQEANAAKSVVFGMKVRGGKVRAMVVKGTDRKTLSDKIYSNVKEGSTLYTDQHSAYARLGSDYQHGVVRHSTKEYVNGMVHTNGIESFWALLKRGYYGTYHFMSKKHLQRYVNEFCGRHNLRDLSLISGVDQVIENLKGLRLTYGRLTHA